MAIRSALRSNIHDSDRTNLRKVINGTVAPGISVKSE